MAKGQTIPDDQMRIYMGEAMRRVQAKTPGLASSETTLANTLTCESGGKGNDKAGTWVDPGKNKAGAAGIGQMFPAAVADSHKLLFGEVLTGDALQKKWKEVTDDPKQSVLYAAAYLANNERIIRGFPEARGITDAAHIRTLVAASYHLGPSGVQTLLQTIMAGGRAFNINAFVEAYERESAKKEGGSVSPRARNEAAGVVGTGSGGGSTTPREPQIVKTGPTAQDALNNKILPLSALPEDAAPRTVPKVIEEGLDVAALFEQSGLPGSYVGNPHLGKGTGKPAWFELRLNRNTPESLSSKTGILRIPLNVSLETMNLRSQQIVDREPTATGLLVTFWGSQPDTITGRGKTGAFINQTGLTALMSNRLTPEAAGWWDMIQEAYGRKELGWENTPTGMTKDQMTTMWGSGGKGPNRFRVAAQDAFVELLMLFKNNGVTRFIPPVAQAAKPGSTTVTAADAKNETIWSPAVGATGFQMAHRVGDVYSRGHVAFRFKGQTYLGYFKTFNFTADAKTPFQWEFDFTFRVLKSLSPVFFPKGG